MDGCVTRASSLSTVDPPLPSSPHSYLDSQISAPPSRRRRTRRRSSWGRRPSCGATRPAASPRPRWRGGARTAPRSTARATPTSSRRRTATCSSSRRGWRTPPTTPASPPTPPASRGSARPPGSPSTVSGESLEKGKSVGHASPSVNHSSVIASSKQGQFPRIYEAKIHYH